MAMTGRIYVMGFANITISAVQDLLAIYAGASKIFALLSVNIDQISGTSVANQRIRIRYLPATVSSGSGGSAGTIKPYIPGDVAATVTGRVNDTVQATSGGTAYDIADTGWNIINGFKWLPDVPSRPPIFGLSTACVVSLDTAPSSVVTNGSIVIEELP